MPGRLCLYDDNDFKNDMFEISGGFRDEIGKLTKCYNLAPTLKIAIYTNENIYKYAHFGLIPSWAKDKSGMQINARSETVYEKPSFKEAYRQRRCLILMNGYYEWRKEAQTQKAQAYFIHASKQAYLACAGIYESWYDRNVQKTIITCALLTTRPNETIAKLHDRMPVVLEKDRWKLWLDHQSDFVSLNTLYQPIQSDKISYYPVGTHVNSVKNDGIACIEEVTPCLPRQMTLF